MENALQVAPRLLLERCTAIVLPDADWSRRVIGDLANRLAAGDPGRAHAVLAPSLHGGFVVSVRAPAGHPAGAAEFCGRFPGGGGRREAAGINRLPAEHAAEFLRSFEKFFES